MESTLPHRNFLTLAYIISGTLALFALKMQNIQWVDEAGFHKRFYHPYIQCLTMFIGEAVCLLAFYIRRARNPARYQLQAKQALDEGKPPAPLLMILVPAFCDFVTSCMQYIAFNYIPASVYQMLKGGGIITTFIFSYLLIGGVTKKNQISGCVLAMVGVVLVGLTAVLFNSESSIFSSRDILIGTTLMVASLITNGFFFAFEQLIFHKYYVSPLYMVGLEGVYGLGISALAVTALTFTPCPFGQKECSFADNGSAYIQRPEQFLREILNNPILLWMTVATVVSIAFFNVVGLTITKHINALARAILNMTKTSLVWVVGIVVTVTVGKNNRDYVWELVNWEAMTMEGVGFLFLILSTLVYNENIRIRGLSEPPRLQERQSLLTETSESL